MDGQARHAGGNALHHRTSEPGGGDPNAGGTVLSFDVAGALPGRGLGEYRES
jgi:hypothetical protein